MAYSMWLVCHDPAASLRLEGPGRYLVGRDQRCCHVSICDRYPYISGVHCVLVLGGAEGSVLVEDLSSNGTYIDGVRCQLHATGRCLLRTAEAGGSAISLGRPGRRGGSILLCLQTYQPDWERTN